MRKNKYDSCIHLNTKYNHCNAGRVYPSDCKGCSAYDSFFGAVIGRYASACGPDRVLQSRSATHCRQEA